MGQSFKNTERVPCPHCNRLYTTTYLESRHIPKCYLNPINLMECVVCDKPVKDYKNSKGTCSHSCSNKHTVRRTRSTSYRTICFANNKKECIVCGETKIVAVHHNDHNHANTAPENLIPLCPTHHQYIHSRYKDEVQPTIDKFITTFLMPL